MGEVKRYDQSEDAYGNSKGMKLSPYGDYVLAEDYDALRAETYLHEVRLADAYEALELLRAENIGMVAQLMAYAGEFPPDQDGLPDTGSIHQNIRKLRTENAEPPVKDEPVAWLCTHHDGRTRVEVKGGVYDQDAGWGASRKPLYLHPPAAQAYLKAKREMHEGCTI